MRPPGAILAANMPPATMRTAARLHVNVDHVATLRQARRGLAPDPLDFARRCLLHGASGITIHLRKDRRHIQDADLGLLRNGLAGFLNLELCLDEEIVAIAESSRMDAFCLVPENRQEVTTEGGLDVLRERQRVARAVPRLSAVGGLVSLFVDPDPEQLAASRDSGAPFVELHTGTYANASGAARERELERLVRAAELARSMGLRINAGHGLDLANVAPIARLPGVEELNIGHSIVALSLTLGVAGAVQAMLAAMGAGASGPRLAPGELPLRFHDLPLAILRGPPDAPPPSWLAGPLMACVKTPSETSLLCPETALPASLAPGWRLRRGLCALEIATALPMEALGVLADLSRCLADAGIPVLCLSTFDTDWLFFDRAAHRQRAAEALAAAGYPLR